MVDKRRNEDEGLYLYSDSNDVINDLRCPHSNHQAIIIGMIFDSLTDAWKFYKAYAVSKGFGVRHGSTRHNSEGVLVGQQFCCSREGFRIEKLQIYNRKRRSRSIQRSGCKASVRVNMDGREKWAITYFEDEHNHDMCHQLQTCFIRLNRQMKPSDLAEAKAMKGVGVRTSHIMNYLTQQTGGIQNVGFTSKDLYNHLNMVSKAEISNGDVVAIIAYFQIKQEFDIGFYMKYSIDDENHLHNLFWADATSWSDYACFGDVVAFDTTYKKNAYDRPLMPIVGVNHHHQTIVFGLALLADETTDTFIWVLRTFLEAMLNKCPISFVTDEDRAMQRAIKTVFPTARHRLCTWHLPRNTKANIPDVLFVEAFNRCMNSWWTREEFDRE